MLEPEELDDRYFMLRVRLDGGALDHRAAARASARSPQTFARDTADVTDRQNIQSTGSGSRTCRRSGASSRPSACSPPRPAATTPRVILGSPVAGHRRRRGDRRHAGDRRDRRALHRRPRSSPTCRASSRPRSPGSRTWRTRSTTSRSSASCTPSTAPASTCGSAAGCPPTRSSPQRLGAWVPLDEVARRLGRRRRRSSATTATAGCATARASSSSSPTGAPRSSARCWRTSTSAAS